MMEDKNPKLEECRGNHTEAMLRYEEFLIYLARHPDDILNLKHDIREIIVNCSECNGDGTLYIQEDEYLEEYLCRSCEGKFENIIEEYNL